MKQESYLVKKKFSKLSYLSKFWKKNLKTRITCITIWQIFKILPHRAGRHSGLTGSNSLVHKREGGEKGGRKVNELHPVMLRNVTHSASRVKIRVIDAYTVAPPPARRNNARRPAYQHQPRTTCLAWRTNARRAVYQHQPRTTCLARRTGTLAAYHGCGVSTRVTYHRYRCGVIPRVARRNTSATCSE